jgi:hypothetical protein
MGPFRILLNYNLRDGPHRRFDLRTLRDHNLLEIKGEGRGRSGFLPSIIIDEKSKMVVLFDNLSVEAFGKILEKNPKRVGSNPDGRDYLQGVIPLLTHLFDCIL